MGDETAVTGAHADAPQFNFEKHRHEAEEQYLKIRPLHVDFCATIGRLLNDILAQHAGAIHSIVARAKDASSFGLKAMKPLESDPASPKYENPVVEITDLSAARIITYFLDTVREIDAMISEQFDVVEKGDRSELLREDEFGYQSIHYLLQLKKSRTDLPEYKRFRGLRFELQVRTILQHAWAEIEHDIQYKSTAVIPREIRRRFKALAGVLELADREFQAIQHADLELRKQSEHEVEIDGDLSTIEITPYALKAYLNRVLGLDGRMSDFSYDYEARNLRTLGFSSLKQVDECIRGYDGDQLNSLLYPTRQGQLSRFEYLLVAAMGEGILQKHRWREDEWYQKRVKEWVAKFRSAGVDVGDYVPGQ